MFIYLRSHLQARLLFWFGMSISLVLIAGSIVLRLFFSELVYDLYRVMQHNQIDIIEQSLHHALLTNDFDLTQEILLNLSQETQLDSIRLIDSQGRVVASSNPEERNLKLKSDSQTCVGCHTGNATAASSVLLPVNDGGPDVMLNASPIENLVVCQSCHSDQQANLGVILTESHTGLVEAWLERLQLILLGSAGGLFLVMSGIYGVSVRHSLVNPLRAFLNGQAGRFARSHPDEIGQVAQYLTDLENSLSESETRAETQSRHFKALLSMSASVNDSFSIEQVFQLVMATVKEVTGFPRVAMRYFDPNQSCFRLVIQDGMTVDMIRELECIPANVGFHAELMAHKRPVYTSDIAQDSRRPSNAPVEAGIKAMVSIPLLSGDRILGSMELASQQVHPFSKDELRWLELVGRSAGNLLHHVELTERLRGMAVLQERTRLAQEIHDGLVQLLGSLRLWAEEAQVAMSDGDQPGVQAAIKKIESTSRDAYNSLREEMLGLRSSITPGSGMVPVLKEYLNRFQRQWEIKTQLVLDRLPEDGSNLHLSPAAEIQLLRIIQESMTNVRRHAEASQATVRLINQPGQLVVEIEDDGKGFEPSGVSQESMGLRIMRERAAGIGGRVEVHTQPGLGTCLRCLLPHSFSPLSPSPV